MGDKKTNWIKKEEANEFLDEPLGASWSPDCIKEDPGLNLGWDETKNNNSVNTLLDAILEAERECCPPPLLVPKAELFLKGPQETSCSTDFIKEDPELNLEDDENETIMEDPTRYASDTVSSVIS
ncbi:uncharacterized protein LOC126213446 [Schistocerca nitens]|uniref:uncharacterized protein LOC126213446 n=1 Tax=Schistocerca nitens TaxID=7011 RepID=UPI0021177036|nr:uncharacterized protein LOC126213446 [Schistocerca nitens]